jgi:phosphoribosyl-ATP pyrophosphohydrolase
VRLSEQEYPQALGEKLKEEAAETAIALSELAREELIGELADLSEVIDSILVLKGIDWAEVKRRQEEKREERGGFSQRIWLMG